jgi:hypothetical protein
MISAGNSWLIAFDNLSSIKANYSDALCQLATGGGYSKRKLYRDTDEVLIEVKRPVLLNGIAELAKREDLSSRSLLFHLPHIAPEQRRSETEIMAELERVHGSALGALLDAVVCALSRHDQVVLDGAPRMADFAKWVVAAEPALPIGDGEFMRAYEENREEIVQTALESDAVAVGILHILGDVGQWSGTMGELLGVLNGILKNHLRQDPYWPKNARGLSSRLSRIGDFLHSAGVRVARGQKLKGRLVVTLTKAGELPVLDCVDDMIDDHGMSVGGGPSKANRVEPQETEPEADEDTQEGLPF